MKNSNRLKLAIVVVILAVIGFCICCCAILMIIGVQSANQSARDVQRRSTAMQIEMKIEEYYAEYGKYPLKTDFTVTRTSIMINPPAGVTVKLQDSNKYRISLTSPSLASNDTSSNETSFAYKVDSVSQDKYWFGVKLEGNSEMHHWYIIGNLVFPYAYVPNDTEKLDTAYVYYKL